MSRAIYRSDVFGYITEVSVDFRGFTPEGRAHILQPVSKDSVMGIWARVHGAPAPPPTVRFVTPGSIRLVEVVDIGACHVCGYDFRSSEDTWRVKEAIVVMSRGVRNHRVIVGRPIVCSDACLERVVKVVPSLATEDLPLGKLIENLLVERSNELRNGEVVAAVRLEVSCD